MQKKTTSLFIVTLLTIVFLSTGVLAWTDNLNTGLENYYTFNDSGVPFVDIINGNNWSLAGGTVSSGTGIIGGALSIDDQAGNVQQNVSFGSGGLTSFTISYWLNTAAGGDSSQWYLNNQQTTGAPAEWMIHIVASGTNAVTIRTKIDGITVDTNGGVVTVDGSSYTHIVHVYNGTDVITYNNGTVSDVQPHTGTYNGAEYFWIGGVNDNSAEWIGEMDEMGWWTRALNQSEVTQLYNNHQGLTYGPTNQPPTFTSIPANVSGDFPDVDVAVQFEATDPEVDPITWSVDNSSFSINQTGFLTNTTLLGGGSYIVFVTIDDGNGGTASVPYQVDVLPFPSVCSLASNTPIDDTEQLLVTGTCDNPEGTLSLFRDGVDVTGENGVLVTLAAGTYEYTVNVTVSQNYTNATYTESFTVDEYNAITNICADTDLTWIDATALAGLIMIMILIGATLSVLVLSFSGIINLGRVTDQFTLANLPAGIIIVGLTFLVIATMSFLIAGNVCPAYGG